MVPPQCFQSSLNGSRLSPFSLGAGGLYLSYSGVYLGEFIFALPSIPSPLVGIQNTCVIHYISHSAATMPRCGTGITDSRALTRSAPDSARRGGGGPQLPNVPPLLRGRSHETRIQ